MTPRRIYLASPYSGDVLSNTDYARACMADSLARGEAPFAPHLLYTQVLDDNQPEQRRLGRDAGAAFLCACDALVVYVDRGVSAGMRAEMSIAHDHDIVVELRLLDETSPARPGGAASLVTPRASTR